MSNAATIACTSLTAVAFAMIVPIQARAEDGQSPLKEAMHDLHPWNAFLVLPLFAFAKAGVSFAGLSMEQAFAPLVIAIALGLFFGKQIGVLGAAWLASAEIKPWRLSTELAVLGAISMPWSAKRRRGKIRPVRSGQHCSVTERSSSRCAG